MLSFAPSCATSRQTQLSYINVFDPSGTYCTLQCSANIEEMHKCCYVSKTDFFFLPLIVYGTLVYFGYDCLFHRFIVYFCMGGINVNTHGLKRVCLLILQMLIIAGKLEREKYGRYAQRLLFFYLIKAYAITHTRTTFSPLQSVCRSE